MPAADEVLAIPRQATARANMTSKLFLIRDFSK
jgi:hypothetical protein